MQSTTIIHHSGAMSVYPDPEDAERAMHLHRTRHISGRLAWGDTEGRATQSAMTAYQYGPSVVECVARIINALHRLENAGLADVVYEYATTGGGRLAVTLLEPGSSYLTGSPRKLAGTEFKLGDREAARDLYRYAEWLEGFGK